MSALASFSPGCVHKYWAAVAAACPDWARLDPGCVDVPAAVVVATTLALAMLLGRRLLRAVAAAPPPKRPPPLWAWVKCVADELRRTGAGAATAAPVTLPVQINEWLLLSDMKGARDLRKLEQLGATHVLSVNGMPRGEAKLLSETLSASGIVHKRVSAEDTEGYPFIDRHWAECQAFFREARASNAAAKVVVHCVAGVNRSGLVACAAHMTAGRVPLVDTVRHVKRLRGALLWNRTFQRQLCELAEREELLGPRPAGYTDEPCDEAALPPPPPPAHAALAGLT